MTAGTGKLFRPSNVTPSKEVIFQLREITGKSPEQVRDAYVASNGDIKKAVAMLTGNQSVITHENSSQVGSNEEVLAAKSSCQKEVIEISDDRDDDLAKAIELSLREAQGGLGVAVSEEDRELSKALEASLVDSRAGNKRKRGNIWLSFIDPENPHERKRKEDVPVGLKNIGNTCWFSAVIQSLFHLPRFRNLILNCELSADAEILKDQPKLAFLAELQKLFFLLLRSKRKYVDPARPIEILEETVRGTGKENIGDQQDVSEFTHVLLDWLEEAFQSRHSSPDSQNPIAELFYGRYTVNGCYNGKVVKSEQTFGALPLHVRGHDHIYDGLDAAMVNNEIRTNSQDPSANSTQEHWFTHLPAVLTFELSRFIFNQELSKAEKIHDPFRIEQTIHLARYMEENKALTREKRRLVDRSKRKRRELLTKLERYMSFGAGPKRNPIINTLDSTLEYIRKGLDRDQDETPMTISPSSSPTSSSMQESAEAAAALLAADKIDGPLPKSITAEEGNTLIDCLQRLKDEVEQETEALKRGIEYIDREVQHAYDEDVLKQVPYRLHAILVHEGHANGGHYWSYIFDVEKKIWRKFNDITVSETTWDEVLRESVGGHRNTSAYCLVYVDACRNDLFELDAMEEEVPPNIATFQNFVDLDNRVFCKEIEDWDAKQRKMDTEIENAPTGDQENNPMFADTKPPSAEAQSNEGSLDDRLESLYSDRCFRMENLSSQRQFFDPDSRLENFSLYFYTSKAPKHVVSRGFLEWFADNISNQEKNEKTVLLQKHARWKLKKLEGDVQKDEEYLQWKQYYKVFLKCNSCFVSGAEEYYSQQYRSALPCFMHAVEVNNQLENADGKPGHMHKDLLSYFRRSCLQQVNDEACTLFQSDDIHKIEEGCILMKELVVPCLASLSETDNDEDLLVPESLRIRWCAFVGSPEIQGRKNEMLEEIIMGLVDSSTKTTVRSPTIKGPLIGTHLFKRHAEIMQHVKNENIPT